MTRPPLSQSSSDGRLYRITLDGSSVPICVVVPLDDDYRKESRTAIMFARDQAPSWLGIRMLKGCERGESVLLLSRDSGSES